MVQESALLFAYLYITSLKVFLVVKWKEVKSFSGVPKTSKQLWRFQFARLLANARAKISGMTSS